MKPQPGTSVGLRLFGKLSRGGEYTLAQLTAFGYNKGMMTEKMIKYQIATEVEYNIRTNDFPVEHTHDYWEIVFVLSGGIFNRINGEEILTDVRSALLVKPDDVHSIRIAENDTVYLNLEMSKELFSRFLNAVDSELLPEICAGENLTAVFDAEYTEKVRQIINDTLLYSTAEEEQKILRRLFFRLLFMMLPERDEITRGQEVKNDKIGQVLNLMSKEENVGLKLRELCKMIGYSESYLVRLFRKKLNTTPNREFTRMKMRYAAKLLRRTDFSVDKIVQMVGYGSKGHFYKLFLAEYKMLPFEYKKMQMKGEKI